MSFLAVVTYIFPGPDITSTLLIWFVPNANAPIAWAPPILNTLLIPDKWAAAKTVLFISPYLFPGDTIIISVTPATFAGIAFINTVLG